MIANILTLPITPDLPPEYAIRHSLIINEMVQQRQECRFFYGERAQYRVENGISRGFKAIVRWHQSKFPNEPCWIVEDDTKFIHPKSCEYFLSQIPSDYDLFLASISGGNIDENNITNDFSGFQCFLIHPRFFHTFLMVSEQKDIDREMTTRHEGKIIPKGKFVVCDKFVAVSHNVYSLHFNEIKDYSDKFQGRPLYDGK